MVGGARSNVSRSRVGTITETSDDSLAVMAAVKPGTLSGALRHPVVSAASAQCVLPHTLTNRFTKQQ